MRGFGAGQTAWFEVAQSDEFEVDGPFLGQANVDPRGDSRRPEVATNDARAEGPDRHDRHSETEMPAEPSQLRGFLLACLRGRLWGLVRECFRGNERGRQKCAQYR